ncbi:hypothetical protein [Photobacterium lutimaris]|uniref:Uncharacterized protein n=1 Tax=Photobacterium lutimaris TaxID=388278 RepID=A0A2T3ITN0_9GAMM|nr:hypothetical protein [Photobacterium lutimaris]PSU31703.1 hypothetical protein C9I99_21180 [Photobacterium lutimaris]TDR72660.1 hypothetical protein DFP78_113136 [Photobacterium lutimaris]
MITHYLGAQLSKNCFINPSYGVVRTNETIQNHQLFGLEPVVVIGVTHADFPIRHRKFFKLDESLSLSGILGEFWSRSIEISEVGAGIISGCPDKLIIDKRLRNLIKDEFLAWLRSQDVDYEFSDGKDRKFAAKMRFLNQYPSPFCLHKLEDKPLVLTPDLAEDAVEKYQIQLDMLNEDFECKFIFFGNHEYPPAKRELLSLMYPIEREVSDFRSSPLKDDCNFDSRLLTKATSNDQAAVHLRWHYAIPTETSDGKHVRYGFMEVNPVDDYSDGPSFFDDEVFDDEAETEPLVNAESMNDDIILNWKETFDGELPQLGQVLVGPLHQRPINRWIVTDDGVPNGWWGEGYVIHIGEPSFICPWGLVSKTEASAMCACYPIEDGRYLAVSFAELIDNSDWRDSTEKLHELLREAINVILSQFEAWQNSTPD